MIVMSDGMMVLLLVLVFGLLFFIVFRILRDAPLKEELHQLRVVERELRSQVDELKAKTGELDILKVIRARLESDLDHERSNALEKIALLQQSELRLKTEFEHLAGRILEERGSSLGEENRVRMASLLQPLKEQLDAFRTRVDEVHRNDTEISARLIEQVRQLQELSGQVSREANLLARAIKGESKAQGDWGELIIERIFEASGLEKGREYTVQESFRMEDGTLKRPDFMVLLPGEKAVIVDSKVSLTAYERYCSLDDVARREQALREHVQSVRRHIAGLQEKEYSFIKGNRTLDFVIMCIPVEPAWQALMQADPEIVYELGRKNVVLTGPTTLMITLKLIAQLWRREKENRNAEVIAEKAGRIYDQVVLIVEAMEDARKKLSGVSQSFDLAMKRLTEGRGSLASKVEEIRRLGAKVSKQLPGGFDDNEEGECVNGNSSAF